MAEAPEKKSKFAGREASNVATALASLVGKKYKPKANEILTSDSSGQGIEAFDGAFKEWEKTLGGTEQRIIRELPTLRAQRYNVFDRMAQDPVIWACLKLHATNALAYNEDAGEVVSVKYVGEETDTQAQEVVDDLKRLAGKLELTERLFAIGLDVLKYGMSPVRIWGEPGRGITHIVHNMMTHPASLKIYEREGKTAGFISRYQQQNQTEGYDLLPPWAFILFRNSGHTQQEGGVSFESYISQMDLGSKRPPEALVEAWNYGQSVLEGTFLPWLDLQESIISLNMSRRNKAKRQTLIAYPVGSQSPARAAALTQAIAQRLKQRKNLDEKMRREGGYAPTQDDFLLPYDTNQSGRVEFNTVEPNVDVNSIEDVTFHLKRICGSLGLDPSLIGFGMDMSGGLGEGSWFRTSIIAAATGEQLRRTIAAGLNRLFEIHIAFKYKLVYPAQEKPWKLQFHAASTAKELEENQTRMLRMDLVDRLSQQMMAFSEAGVGVDKSNFAKYVIHQMLGLDEEDFTDIWSKNAPPAPDGTAKDFATGGSGGGSSSGQNWDDDED